MIKKMSTRRKCPYCGSEVPYDNYTTEELEEEIIYYYSGVCPKCGKEYRWTVFFKFAFETDLEES